MLLIDTDTKLIKIVGIEINNKDNMTNNKDNMTNNKDNMTKCGNRFRAVSDKFVRETKRIDTLSTEALSKRLEEITDIRNMGPVLAQTS
jgi:hypothetical protein